MLLFSTKNNSDKFKKPFWFASVCALGRSVALVAMFLVETGADRFCTGTTNLGADCESMNKELIMMLLDYPQKNLFLLSSTDCILLANACNAYLEKDDIARSEELTTVVSSFLTTFQSFALMLQYEFRITPKDQDDSHREIMEAKI